MRVVDAVYFAGLQHSEQALLRSNYVLRHELGALRTRLVELERFAPDPVSAHEETESRISALIMHARETQLQTRGGRGGRGGGRGARGKLSPPASSEFSEC